MKQKDLQLIGVEQELIDRLILFKKQIKELKKLIDSSKKGISKKKKEKPEKKRLSVIKWNHILFTI